MGPVRVTPAPIAARERGRPALLALCAVAVALVGAHAAVAIIVGHVVASGVLAAAVFVVASLACLARAALVSRDRVLWSLVGLALACYGAGNTYFAIAVAGNPSAPYPSLADAGYLAFYPLMAAALIVGLRSRQRGVRGLVALDVVTGALAAAAVGASVAYPVLAAAVGGTPSAVATTLAYPIADVVLIAIATVRLVTAPERRTAGWVLVLVGLLSFATADVAFANLTASDAYVPGSLLDSLWPLGAACWASAAVLRGDVASFGALRKRPPVEGWPALFAVAAITILVFDHFHRANLAALWLAVATLAAAVARMVLTLRENRRLLAARERDLLTDDLTGLPNRRGFAANARRQLASGRRRGASAALLTLGIDRFKYVNDALGPEAGDLLIAAVGRILSDELREGDLAGRLGGDEFAIVLNDIDEAGAGACAERLCAAVRGSRFCGGIREGQLTVSIGVALVPGSDEMSCEAALANANAAMYRAKENGRDGYAIDGASALGASLLKERFDWSTRLRQALTEGTFELYAQPIVDLVDGETCAHELLLRLREGERLWSPGVFLPEAERFGLMPEIDRWVIARAIELARTAPTPLTVNISPATVNDAPSRSIVIESLRVAALPKGRLMFEVTETAALTGADTARAFADQLHELGCGLALDDFGVAFASFLSLKQLPFDVVKIDGSLIRDIVEDEMDSVFVEAIARAARRVGKRTVAEHVTSYAALDLLRGLGVDMAQAYLLGLPAPVAEAFALARREPLAA